MILKTVLETAQRFPGSLLPPVKHSAPARVKIPKLLTNDVSTPSDNKVPAGAAWYLETTPWTKDSASGLATIKSNPGLVQN